MKYTFTPHGVCPTKISLEIDEDIVKNVNFIGGCDGNLQAMASLLEGMPASQIKERLSGIKCGRKSTSCADQLVKGLDQALSELRGADESDS